MKMTREELMKKLKEFGPEKIIIVDDDMHEKMVNVTEDYGLFGYAKKNNELLVWLRVEEEFMVEKTTCDKDIRYFLHPASAKEENETMTFKFRIQ